MNRKKILILAVVAAQALLLALTAIWRLRDRESSYIDYSPDMLSMAQELESGLEVKEGVASIAPADQGKNRRIYTPEFNLDRGVYAVSVQYRSTTPYASSLGCRSMAVCDDEYPWIFPSRCF